MEDISMNKEVKKQVKAYNKELESFSKVSRANFICLTARLDAESPADNVSITQVMERLDIELLLQRAQAGILDLRAYQRPMSADVVGAGGTPEEIERATRLLLQEPDSPTSRVFGVDKETANKALKDLHSLANQYKVTKKEEPPAPEPAKDNDKGDPAKGDSD